MKDNIGLSEEQDPDARFKDGSMPTLDKTWINSTGSKGDTWRIINNETFRRNFDFIFRTRKA